MMPRDNLSKWEMDFKMTWLKFSVLLAGIFKGVLGQQTAGGQCGGIGWTGDTACIDGYCCENSNDRYSQCTQGSCSVDGGSQTTLATTTRTTPVSSPTSIFTNPVLWEDLADNEVIRVDDAYYLTASTMHYSPGAPILHSYDLVNWEYIGHAVPTLSWSSKYDLTGGQRAYVKGIWASTMQYRKSNGLWYWIGCIEFGKTYVYTASRPEGPWAQRSVINTCYYDAGLLIDDNDTMYVAYGNSQISVAQLSSDGFAQVRTQLVYTTPGSIGTLEGSRFYKRGGWYYIFVTRPANGQYILRSESPFGSYGIRELALNMPSPVAGSGYPHQGSLVDTPNGDWYYMAFIDAYPGGRVPVLAPITWTTDAWPTIQAPNGRWPSTSPYPLAKHPLTPTTRKHTFPNPTLDPAWEWNHNPDPTKFSLQNQTLTLSTASITTDIYSARNTLTHRIHGPVGVGTLELDVSNMRVGDRAGLVLLRDQSAWVGVRLEESGYEVCYVDGIVMNGDWTTRAVGDVGACAGMGAGGGDLRVWLRVRADVMPGGSRGAKFYYSVDGEEEGFVQLGDTFYMNSDWHFFMGYRYGIFNYGTKALGGSVGVVSFTSE